MKREKDQTGRFDSFGIPRATIPSVLPYESELPSNTVIVDDDGIAVYMVLTHDGRWIPADDY